MKFVLSLAFARLDGMQAVFFNSGVLCSIKMCVLCSNKVKGCTAAYRAEHVRQYTVHTTASKHKQRACPTREHCCRPPSRVAFKCIVSASDMPLHRHAYMAWSGMPGSVLRSGAVH